MAYNLQYFYIDIANELGVIPSIVFTQLIYMAKVKTQEKSTYNALCMTEEYKKKVFPYISITTIENALDKLVKNNFIVVTIKEDGKSMRDVYIQFAQRGQMYFNEIINTSKENKNPSETNKKETNKNA